MIIIDMLFGPVFCPVVEKPKSQLPRNCWEISLAFWPRMQGKSRPGLFPAHRLMDVFHELNQTELDRGHLPPPKTKPFADWSRDCFLVLGPSSKSVSCSRTMCKNNVGETRRPVSQTSAVVFGWSSSFCVTHDGMLAALRKRPWKTHLVTRRWFSKCEVYEFLNQLFIRERDIPLVI
jgi:hypothetical protein